MQTILGSGGAIGTELAKVLPSYTKNVRLVSRNPKPVTGKEELTSADLMSAGQVDQAVKGLQRSSRQYSGISLPKFAAPESRRTLVSNFNRDSVGERISVPVCAGYDNFVNAQR